MFVRKLDGGVVFAQGTRPKTFVELASSGDANQVKVLLASNPALVHDVNPHGSTALVAAAASGHLEIVNILIEGNADLNKPGFNGYNAILWAAHNDHAAVVEVLLRAGAKPGVCDKWNNTPLYCAVENGNAALVAVLLKFPDNLFDVKHNQTGLTALELAQKLASDADNKDVKNKFTKIADEIRGAQAVNSSSCRPGR